MFKVGDIVEITAESDATGMLEFKSGKGYVVQGYQRVAKAGVWWEQVYLCGEGNSSEGWYAASHFKLKEDTVVEKKECLFKKGQVVWDLRNGRGVVREIVDDGRYPVVVKFDLKDTEGYEVTDYYTADGRFAITQNIRSLYFSEPKIEAATEPLFEPVLKKGDWVVLSDNTAQAIVRVVNETDFELFYEGDGVVSGVFKNTVDVYRLGEKIKFN